MKTYDVFLDYYDKIVRNINNNLDDEIDFLVNDCIKKYKPETKSILELACGTGVVANELVKNGFFYTGLDINEKMLDKAKKNLVLTHPGIPSLKSNERKKIELVLGDMTNFDLQKKFDCILCNYNSICHLLNWQDWQNFFEMSLKHLEKGGLLIFDINTLFEFENITRDFAQFYNFGDDSVCLEMFKKTGYFEWLIKIFKKAEDGRYDLIQEQVKENSFPVSKIKKELKEKGFEILDLIDYHYIEVTALSERVYFICRKK